MTMTTLFKLPIFACMLAILLFVLLQIKRRRVSRIQEGMPPGAQPRSRAKGLLIRIVLPLFMAALFLPILFYQSQSSGDDAASNGDNVGPGIYSRYQGRIYMNIGGEGEYLVPGADAASFGPFPDHELDSGNIGRDRHAVYCGSRAIAKLRPEQVHFISNSYVSDGRQAWYCTSEKNNPDYHWWQIFLNKSDEDSPNKPREQDYMLVPLKSVNADALKALTAAYAQDGVHAYYEGRLIPGADGASLQTVVVSMGVDDPETTTDEYYARDSQHIYFQGTPLPGAHPAAFFAFAPDDGDQFTRYGQDRTTGQFYVGATPFPAKVDGVDSSALHLLIADRNRANQDIFYNASGLWFWDYQDHVLKRGCANPFAGSPTMLSPGIWTDGRNTVITKAIEQWRSTMGDQSLASRKTQLWTVPGARWTKVADLSGKSGDAAGTLWKEGAQLYFAPSAGQDDFLNDAVYLVNDLEGLKRDLLTDHYHSTILRSGDVERLDSSDSTIVCRMSSNYPPVWEFWK